MGQKEAFSNVAECSEHVDKDGDKIKVICMTRYKRHREMGRRSKICAIGLLASKIMLEFLRVYRFFFLLYSS